MRSKFLNGLGILSYLQGDINAKDLRDCMSLLGEDACCYIHFAFRVWLVVVRFCGVLAQMRSALSHVLMTPTGNELPDYKPKRPHDLKLDRTRQTRNCKLHENKNELAPLWSSRIPPFFVGSPAFAAPADLRIAPETAGTVRLLQECGSHASTTQ